MGNMALSRDFLVDHSFWDRMYMEGKNKHLSHGHKPDLQINFLFMPYFCILRFISKIN